MSVQTIRLFRCRATGLQHLAALQQQHRHPQQQQAPEPKQHGKHQRQLISQYNVLCKTQVHGLGATISIVSVQNEYIYIYICVAFYSNINPFIDPPDTYGYGITPALGVMGGLLMLIGLHLMSFGFRIFRGTLAIVGFTVFGMLFIVPFFFPSHRRTLY